MCVGHQYWSEDKAPPGYRRFTQFLDRVAGMTQENFTADIRRQREPGVFHGLPQHLADKFENELDSYAWNLGGLSAGRWCRVSLFRRKLDPFSELYVK